MNKELYDKLICAALLLVGIQKEDDKIAKTKNEIDNLNYQLTKAKENTKSKPRGYKPKKVWGIILTSFWGYGGCVMTIMTLAGGSESQGMLPALVTSFGFILLGILLLISARKKRLKHQANCIKEYEELQKTTAENVEKLNNEIEYISEKKEIFRNLHKGVIEFLPPKYHTLDAVGFIYKPHKHTLTTIRPFRINLFCFRTYGHYFFNLFNGFVANLIAFIHPQESQIYILGTTFYRTGITFT